MCVWTACTHMRVHLSIRTSLLLKVKHVFLISSILLPTPLPAFISNLSVCCCGLNHFQLHYYSPGVSHGCIIRPALKASFPEGWLALFLPSGHQETRAGKVKRQSGKCVLATGAHLGFFPGTYTRVESLCGESCMQMLFTNAQNYRGASQRGARPRCI